MAKEEPILIDKLDLDINPALISTLLLKGFNQSKIAKITNVSRQYISQYIQKYKDQIAKIQDDQYLINLTKANAIRANEKLYLSIDKFEGIKSEAVPLNIVAGTQSQRYAELTGKLGNTTITLAISGQISESSHKLEELEAELQALTHDTSPLDTVNDNDSDSDTDDTDVSS